MRAAGVLAILAAVAHGVIAELRVFAKARIEPHNRPKVSAGGSGSELSTGDRGFESGFLQPRVINELSPGGTAIVPRPHYDAHGASAECTDLFELAVYRPGTALVLLGHPPALSYGLLRFLIFVFVAYRLNHNPRFAIYLYGMGQG